MFKLFGKNATAASTTSASKGMTDMSSLYKDFIGHRMSFTTTDGDSYTGGIILHNVTHDGVVLISECGNEYERNRGIYIYHWNQLSRLVVNERPQPVETDIQ